MFFFPVHSLYFFSSFPFKGNSAISIKKPVSFNVPLFTQFYFFYFFYFHNFYKECLFYGELLGKTFQHNNVLLTNTSFFFSAVTLSTCGYIKRGPVKTSVCFLLKHFSVFSNLRLFFYTEGTSRIFPLFLFLQGFDTISVIFLPSAAQAAAGFDGCAALKPRIFASSARGYLRLFFLNFHLFWELAFFSLSGVHNFFFYKLRAVFNLLYVTPCLLRTSFSFWQYFSTFLFLGMSERFCSLLQLAPKFERVLVMSFLRSVGGPRVLHFNSIILRAFSSIAFFVFSFLDRFVYTQHFHWFFHAYLKHLPTSWPKRNVLSRKLSLFVFKKPINFFQSAAFQLVFSIQKRGLKVRAFNFIFSFLLFLGFEKAENFELFMQESLITYAFSRLFFNLRLPFQVYNTKLRGKSLQLPTLLPRAKSMVLAFKLFIVCVKKRSENGFLSKIFSEFYDLINDNGLALKQKAVTVRLAFSNKNLLFFRATRFTFGQQRRKKGVIL